MTTSLSQIIQNTGDFIIFGASSSYLNVAEITAITEDITQTSGTLLKYYRWSYNNNSYSQWVELSVDSLNEEILYLENDEFWIQFKYELVDEGDVTINSVSLEVTLQESAVLDKPIPTFYSKEKGNKHWPVRMKSFTWNPYRQNESIKLQKDLSFTMNQIYGHEVTYFRAVPKADSRDVVFLEWTLFDVSPAKCLKVVVPENTFPEMKLNHNAFGVDFELPFEVHVDKRYFESIFGHNSHPQKRDIIHFPLTNRMYEVSSSAVVGEFMHEFLYWNVSLVKYQPKHNRIMTDEIRDSIENYTTGIDDMFGDELQTIMEDITNPKQLKDATLTFDPVRLYVESAEMSIQETLLNYHTTVAQYYYDFYKLYLDSQREYARAVQYKEKNTFGVDKDLSYTCWFRNVQHKSTSKDILSVELLENELTINYSTAILPYLKVGKFIGIGDTNSPNFGVFGEVISFDNDPSKLQVVINVDDYIIQAADAIFPTWKTSTNLLSKEVERRNFLWGFDEDLSRGLAIDTFDMRYIRIKLNSDIIWFPFTTPLEYERWYGFAVNILNTFGQVSFHIWERQESTEKTTGLRSVLKRVINNLPNIDRSVDVNYEILASPLHLTNIRLMDVSLEEDEQSSFLNKNIVKNSSHAIIIDNAIPRIQLPYAGQVK